MNIALPNGTLRFSLLLLAGLLGFPLAAQQHMQYIPVSPDEVSYQGRVPCNNNAGDIANFGPFIGESNDAVPDTIYLCFGDSVFVNHDEISVNLSGDPVPNTPAGIGYALYECEPTIVGPDRATIATDPCAGLVGDDPPSLGFYIDAGEDLSGDSWFWNLGQVQAFFTTNGNPPEPQIIWFAPITYDLRDMDTDLASYEREDNDPNNPAGPCVDVSIDQAFAVAYLNQVTITDVQGSSCEGSFRVQGGLPELEAGEEYNINIFLSTNPSITATVTSGPATHDDVVTFEIPQPGDYIIEVEDGKSCPASQVITLNNCDAVVFNFPFLNVLPGDNFCVPVTVEGFTNVFGIQYTMNYDPAILQFTAVQGYNPNMPPDFGPLAFFAPPDTPDGQILILYSSAVPTNVPDGEALFELCFTAIGNLGQCSPLEFNDDPVVTIIGTSDGTGPPEPSAFIQNDGEVCISAEPFFLGTAGSPVSCSDAADGSITATVSGGIGPYDLCIKRISPPQTACINSVTIDGDGAMTTFTGLAPGEYCIQSEDSNNNIVRDTIELVSPPFLGVSVVGEGPFCFGEANGSIRAILTLDNVEVIDPVSQGYVFSWNLNTANTDILTGLEAGGFYSVTVTSPNECMSMGSGQLSGASQLFVEPMTDADATTNATCFGAMDGDITVSASGGTSFPNSEYQFDWLEPDLPPVLSTDATVSNLNPGAYTVVVTDFNGCTDTATYNIIPDKILSINAIVDSVTCFADQDGGIFATGATDFNIPSGMPDLPYTFQWNGLTSDDTNTTTEVGNLGPGLYFLTMTDNAGCEVVDSFEVFEPELLAIDLVEVTNETCTTGNDGQAILTISGGVQPYTYAWSHDPMLTDSIADSLSAGNYSVIVTDVNGCTTDRDYIVSAPTPPSITSFPDDFVSCPDATDGMLSLTATPGAAPINLYQWFDETDVLIASGVNVTSRNNLSPGTYYVIVSDEGSCATVDTAVVASPGFVFMDSVQIVQPTCPGESTGSITIFPNGGTAPYEFNWSTDPFTPTTINPLPNLSADTYFVTVTDANDCPSLVDTIVVEDPPAIVGFFTDLSPTSCPGDQTCDGSATISVQFSDGSGGIFDFEWFNSETTMGASTSTITDLCPQPISVEITDGICSVIVEDSITAPEQISVNVVTEPVSCFGDEDGEATLTAMGGTGPYTYQWVEINATGPMQTGLDAATNTVVVRDDNGCSFQQIVVIDEPDELVLDIDPGLTTPTVVCAGDANGIISVFVSSSNSNPLLPAPYTWSGGVANANESVATGLAPGTYTVSVEDVQGCTDDVSFTIGEPPAITFSVLPIEEPLCFGQTTLVLIDTAFGGSSTGFNDFTFSVNNNGFQIPVSQPGSTFAGQTIVTVFDTVGCTASDTFSVNQPPEITVSLPAVDTVELGDSLTVLNPIISPAGDIYEYFWSPAEFLSSDSVRNPTIFPLDSRLYTLEVTNANGCQAFGEIFIEVDANRNVYIPNAFTPNRDGRNEDFRIYACQGVSNINRVQIFDRWGGLMYDEENLDPNCLDGIRTWDGTKNGRPLNPNVFVYMVEVEFLDGAVLLYRGDLTLLR
ncbi:MAG: gliding motility-associated C-terminal domain-containing protein [Bacteroidota bacterium]